MTEKTTEIEFSVRATLLVEDGHKGTGSASVSVSGDPIEIMRAVLTAMYAYPEFKSIVLTCAEGYLSGVGRPENLRADRL